MRTGVTNRGRVNPIPRAGGMGMGMGPREGKNKEKIGKKGRISDNVKPRGNVITLIDKNQNSDLK